MLYRLITRAVGPIWVLLVIGSMAYSSVVGIMYDTADHVGPPLAIMTFCLVTPFALCIFDKIFKTQVSCDTFEWHNGDGDGTAGFDGCSYFAHCSKCGKRVLRDSQGNWFESHRQEKEDGERETVPEMRQDVRVAVDGQ